MTHPTKEAFAQAQQSCAQRYHRLHRVRRLDGNDYFLLLAMNGEVIENCMTWESVQENINRLEKHFPPSQYSLDSWLARNKRTTK